MSTLDKSMPICKLTPLVVLDALQNEDYVIRQEACGALGAVGQPDVVLKLEQLSLTDPHGSVRAAAKIALNCIQTNRLSDTDKAKSLEKLIADENKMVRTWALDTLASECGHEGRVVLQKIAEEDSPAGVRSRWYLIVQEEAQLNGDEKNKK